VLADIGLILLGFIIIAIIIAFNGYFVAQEFAYMAVDRPTLRSRAEKGDVGAKRALKVTNRTSFMLSGAQLGITVTGLLVGYVAEPLVGQSLGSILGTTGIPPALSVTVATVFALVLAAVVQMIFGELFPKNLAIANPTPLSIGLSRSTLIYLAVFGWVIAFFDKASNALLRLIRVEPVHDLDASANAEDLEHIVENSRDSGDLPEDLFVLLDRILDFPERDVEHAMVPRSQVGFLTPGMTLEQALSHMAKSHTRYPIIGEGDNPLGVLHLSDILSASAPMDSQVEGFMRPALVVPTAMKLPEALRLMAESKNEMACVIDEYGGFTGLVTIEDLGEELVGDIRDEHDAAASSGIEEISENKWLISGDTPIDEIERSLGVDAPEGDWETLAGMLIGAKGALPEVGDLIKIELQPTPEDITDRFEGIIELHARVVSVRKRVPLSVEVEIVRIESEDQESEIEGQK
jgi:CBS domain containing-hemolysin-like protein